MRRRISRTSSLFVIRESYNGSDRLSEYLCQILRPRLPDDLSGRERCGHPLRLHLYRRYGERR